MCSPQSTYAPMVSSPLNPSVLPPSKRRCAHACEAAPPAAAAAWMRPVPTQAKRRPSPSEKLLRRKAAEAWKSEAIHRQVVEYERLALEAIMARRLGGKGASMVQETAPSRDDDPARSPRMRCGSVSASDADQEEENLDEEDDEDEDQSVSSEKAVQWNYLFPLPKLGFLSPRTLVRSFRFMRVFISWRVRLRREADQD